MLYSWEIGIQGSLTCLGSFFTQKNELNSYFITIRRKLSSFSNHDIFVIRRRPVQYTTKLIQLNKYTKKNYTKDYSFDINKLFITWQNRAKHNAYNVRSYRIRSEYYYFGSVTISS